MTSELSQRLTKLGTERARLESLLARHPVWCALRQLERQPAPVDAAAAAMLIRRRGDLEWQLAGHPVFEAHRSVVEAMAMLEEMATPLVAEAVAEPASPHVETAANPTPAALPRVRVLAARAGRPEPQPIAAAPPASNAVDVSALASPATARPETARNVELLSVGRSVGGGGIATRSATIHGALPGHQGMPDRLPADAAPDDLTRIRRIDRALAAALVARGVRSFAQISAFGAADVRSLAAALGLGRRISQENWIEQAAVLALKQKARVVHTQAQQAQPPLGAPLSPAPPRSLVNSADPVVANASVAAAPKARVAVAVEHDLVATAGPDIASVARAIAAEVARRAVATSEGSPQVMAAEAITPAPPVGADVVRATALRIAQVWRQPAADAMVGQARATEPDLTDAAAGESAVADRLDDADGADATSVSVVAADDDLTLVRGIDVAMRDVLSDLGVSHFAEIAAWGAADVRAASEILGADAHIWRDGWIEQAALLARGELTHHARRIARGEHHALAARPAVPAQRDEAFAAWLAQHAASHPMPSVGSPDHQPSAAQDVADHEPSAQQVSSTVAANDMVAPPVVEALTISDTEPEEPVEQSTPQRYAEPALGPDLEHAEPVSDPASPQLLLGDEIPVYWPPVESVIAYDKLPQPLATIAPVTDHASMPTPDDRPQPGEQASAMPPSVEAAASLWSIADRITAIERDAADLSARSRSSSPARFPASPHARREHEQLQRSGRGRTDSAARSGFAEAEVRIVTRKVHGAPIEPVAPLDPFAPEAADVGMDEYAAYRAHVAEASVEIVRDGRLFGAGDCGTGDMPGDMTGKLPGTGGGGDVAASLRASSLAPAQQGRVRRFLKALKGE